MDGCSYHSQYRDYVARFIPQQRRPWLDAVLGERHLIEIGKYITEWQVKLEGPLGLTREDVSDINEIGKPELRRRKVLRVWKDKNGLKATYALLLNSCLEGGDTRTAQKICELLASSPAPAKISRGETSAMQRGPPMTQPRSHDYKGSLWDADFNLAYLQLIKYIDPTTGHHEQIKIFAEVAHKWEEIARLLGLTNADIVTIQSPGTGRTLHTCLMQVVGRWESNGTNLKNHKSYPENWRGVYHLLRDSEQGNLAKKLHVALDAEVSNIRGNYSEDEEDVSVTSNGSRNGHHHEPQLDHRTTHIPNGNSGASPIPEAVPQATPASTTHDTNGTKVTRKKLKADEMAKWLGEQGIDSKDIEILNGHGLNERLFLRLTEQSSELTDVSLATKEQLAELQEDLKQSVELEGKRSAEKMAEWLDEEGIDPKDIEILKSHGVNQRLFLRLTEQSSKLKDVTQATKQQLKELQAELNDR